MNAGMRYQQGVTLLVGMIMLLLMTILAVTVFQLGKGDLIVVSNAQQRSQSIMAAQAVIEEALSTATFMTNASNAISQPCNGIANTRCVDIDANQSNDFSVALRPSCLSARVLSSQHLNYSDTGDASCVLSASQDTGISGVGTNASLCANMLWDLEATASDRLRQSEYVINQGVSVRVAADKNCP